MAMESLKSDLKSIQGVIKDLLTRLGGDLPVASWKFPEKLASSLDPLLLLKEQGGEGGDNVLLLELVVDRLLFLLQCCVRFSETSQGHKSTSFPLTLGSAVKKISRRLQQDHSILRETQEKLSVSDQTIRSLESSVSSLQSTVQQLQQVPTVTSTTEIDHTPVSRVPYEALGTMKMNRLSSSVDLVSLGPKAGPGANNIINSMDCAGPESFVVQASVLTNSVHTQTTETGFALCVRCTDTQTALVDLAQCVTEVASTHGLSSSLAQTDWGALVKMEGLETQQWTQCFRRDLECLDSCTSQLEGRVDALVTELNAQRELVGRLEEEINTLSSQVDSLQATIDDVQKHGETSLANVRKELGDQLRELKETCSQLEAANLRVSEQLTSSKKHEAMIKSRMAELELKRTELQRELGSAQNREVLLLSSRQALERKLEIAGDEVVKCKDQLEKSNLELAKTRISSKTMEKKNKAIVSKQTSLLSRLDELDQECSELREGLWKVQRERDELSSEVAGIHSQCQQLKEELELEKDKLSQSVEEQEQMRVLYSHLEVQAAETRTKLEDEREKCRLLMDYPFIKQTSEGYAEHISSLSAKDSQRQISANTVRILLLEEQNSDLRERNIRLARKLREEGGSSTAQLFQPVRMWRDKLLTKVNSEQSLAREASASSRLRTNERDIIISKQGSAKSQGEQASSGVRRPQSSGSFKGRLGHLVAAIADAQHSASPGTSTELRQTSTDVGRELEDNSSSLDMYGSCDETVQTRHKPEHLQYTQSNT